MNRFSIFSILKFSILLVLLQSVFNNAFAQLYPEYGAPQQRKKKQKEVPKFPPQFHSRDTVGGKKPVTTINPQNPTVKKTTTPTKPFVRTDSFVTVISKKEDANGNITTIQEVTVGKKKTRQTIITGGRQLNKPFNVDTINKDSITIQVVKKNYKMYIYHKHKFLTAYKCVFGLTPMEQKRFEGDKRTPEGWFKILAIRPHSDWTMFMLLDYPNEESFKNYATNQKNGFIPKGVGIGGAVGIHGVLPEAEGTIDTKRNWTDGCIALKNSDLLELSKIVKVGTPIYVKRNQ